MADAILDALLDTAKLIPWLLVMHLLIELFEASAASKIKMNKVLRGPLAPVLGSACGILPQCGFGVVAANLYSRRSIRLGTMIAVFIATSDEAIPIMLSSPSKAALIKLGALLGCKFVAAIIAGYALNALLSRRETLSILPSHVAYHGCHHHTVGDEAHCGEHSHVFEDAARAQAEPDAVAHEHEHGHTDSAGHEHDDNEKHDEGHAHDEKGSFEARMLIHPLVHTLTVTLYILIVNLLFAVVLFYVGEAKLQRFLESARFYQPLLAGLVGLIPNCASSVMLAQMLASGNLSLGAAFAGLSVNAGLGLAVLIKNNRPASHTLAIIAGLYAYSVVLGELLTLLPL